MLKLGVFWRNWVENYQFKHNFMFLHRNWYNDGWGIVRKIGTKWTFDFSARTPLIYEFQYKLIC